MLLWNNRKAGDDQKHVTERCAIWPFGYSIYDLPFDKFHDEGTYHFQEKIIRAGGGVG